MIAHLRGRLLSKTPNQAIVDCNGVGYDVIISVATFSELPSEGAEARLFIHTHVREDQIALFGFADTQEKRLFETSADHQRHRTQARHHRAQRDLLRPTRRSPFAGAITPP